MNRAIGGHFSTKMKSDTYLTPKWILDELGEFDLDPCTPIGLMPWKTANKRYTKEDDGLSQDWEGRVWLNPPYGREAVKWTKKLSEHNNGTALLLNRSETKDWFETIWYKAEGILFLKGRIYFHDQSGKRLPANCGAPPVLVAYGENNGTILSECKIPGKYVPINYTPVIVVGVSPSWFQVVSLAIRKIDSDSDMKVIYDMVENIAPEKVMGNKHWKEKIRQKVQEYRRKK